PSCHHSYRVDPSLTVVHDAAELSKVVHQKIGLRFVQSVTGKAISHAASGDCCVASGLDVDVGVSHHHGPFACHPSVTQDLLNAHGMRFLLLKTVAAVDSCKPVVNSQSLKNCQRRPE